MIILQFIANGLVMGSIYALVALGFALIYNTTRIFHIAYAVLYMFSPYMFLSLYNYIGCPFYVAFIVSIFLTVLLSLAIEQFVYQPLNRINSSLNIVMISSIGVMIVVINAIALFYGNETKIINNNISQTVSLNAIILTDIQLWQFGVSLAIIGFFFLFLKFSKFGIRTRAIRDNDTLSRVFTINVKKIRLILFALSAFFVAVAGNLVAYDVGMDPYVGMPILLTAVVALIVGGVGNFAAPVLGGFIIGMMQSITVLISSARWQDAVIFTLLIIFLMFRPQGILGEKQRAV
ncbi:MAG: branched-chain amino acid ABC transporter permease [Candidatus Thermoplasmatota archaeon]|nr:branched-chain amino acid ABC transporter permease [Candidatus Thermoplasmatota archaeon]